jgi:hypothetical protein
MKGAAMTSFLILALGLVGMLTWKFDHSPQPPEFARTNSEGILLSDQGRPLLLSLGGDAARSKAY